MYFICSPNILFICVSQYLTCNYHIRSPTWKNLVYFFLSLVQMTALTAAKETNGTKIWCQNTWAHHLYETIPLTKFTELYTYDTSFSSRVSPKPYPSLWKPNIQLSFGIWCNACLIEVYCCTSPWLFSHLQFWSINLRSYYLLQ
jgi:hypothetical protein